MTSLLRLSCNVHWLKLIILLKWEQFCCQICRLLVLPSLCACSCNICIVTIFVVWNSTKLVVVASIFGSELEFCCGSNMYGLICRIPVSCCYLAESADAIALILHTLSSEFEIEKVRSREEKAKVFPVSMCRKLETLLKSAKHIFQKKNDCRELTSNEGR